MSKTLLAIGLAGLIGGLAVTIHEGKLEEECINKRMHTDHDSPEYSNLVSEQERYLYSTAIGLGIYVLSGALLMAGANMRKV